MDPFGFQNPYWILQKSSPLLRKLPSLAFCFSTLKRKFPLQFPLRRKVTHDNAHIVTATPDLIFAVFSRDAQQPSCVSFGQGFLSKKRLDLATPDLIFAGFLNPLFYGIHFYFLHIQ